MRRTASAWCFVMVLIAYSSNAVSAKSGQQCRHLKVLVEVQGVDCRPTAPSKVFDVVVRARNGQVLTKGKTGSDGKASLRVCWRDENPPARVEATFQEGEYLEGLIRGYDGRQEGICFLLSLIHRSDCE